MESEYLAKAREHIELGMQINHKFMPWIDISRREDKISEKTGWKIHVSIHPDDYDKMVPLIAKLMEYRDKYGIGAKFATKGWADEMVDHSTQRGKTITVYVPEDRAELAPQIVRELESIIKKEGIRTHHPAPNDEIVGETGAIGVAYAHFGGKHVAVKEGYRHIYGDRIEDHARRRDPRLAVPLWKEKEFYKLFGKIPANIAVFKALIAAGYDERTAFEKMRELNLRKEEHVEARDRIELKPGTVVGIKNAEIYRIWHPDRRSSETAVAPFILLHGGWRSGMGAPAYVLSSRGYAKIAVDVAKFRRVLEKVEHMHEDPHVLIERQPGILRIHNIGKETLMLERVR